MDELSPFKQQFYIFCPDFMFYYFIIVILNSGGEAQ
jgi:hypothetical protein